MINLFEKDTKKPLGQISEAQLQYLIDHLEEEGTEDQDYAVTPLLLEYFEGIKTTLTFSLPSASTAM